MPSVKTKQNLSVDSVFWYPGMYFIYICSDVHCPFRQLSHLVCCMSRSVFVQDRLLSFAVH